LWPANGELQHFSQLPILKKRQVGPAVTFVLQPKKEKQCSACYRTTANAHASPLRLEERRVSSQNIKYLENKQLFQHKTRSMPTLSSNWPQIQDFKEPGFSQPQVNVFKTTTLENVR